MTADPELIGRKCESKMHPELFRGRVRAVWLGVDHKRRPHPCLLVERMDDQQEKGMGTFWTTQAGDVVMAKDAPELSLKERGLKVHVPTIELERPAARRGIVAKVAAWLGGHND